MRRTVLVGATVILAVGIVEIGSAAAGDVSHGIRVHRLATAKAAARTKVRVIRLRAPRRTQPRLQRHTHAIALRKVLQARPIRLHIHRRHRHSLYRRRHPGIARPWRWRSKPRSRAFMNPPGLYRSKIYRPGYF